MVLWSMFLCIEDVKRCLANGDLASFVESMGISTDDVWTGALFTPSKLGTPPMSA